MSKKYDSAYEYILLLFGIALFLHFIKYIIHKNNIYLNLNIKQEILSYMYIFFFSIISGILLFFGYENFNDFFYSLLKNKTLAQLSTTTIVIAFSFLYAAYFKDIVSKLFNTHLENDVWKNIIGYLSGRFLLIIIIFLLVVFYIKNNK